VYRYGVLISITETDGQYITTHHFHEKQKKRRSNSANKIAERLALATCVSFLMRGVRPQ
jgi:hypothetical protein